MLHYVGLDVSQKTTAVDEQGRQLWRCVCVTDPEPIEHVIARSRSVCPGNQTWREAGPASSRLQRAGVPRGKQRRLRVIALGRKSWLFAGSDRGGRRAAALYSLIVTAKMNDVDPQAWPAACSILGAVNGQARDRRSPARGFGGGAPTRSGEMDRSTKSSLRQQP